MRIAAGIVSIAVMLASAGCLLPGGAYGVGDLTVASLLRSGGGLARLVGLPGSGGDISVPLPSDRSSFLIFNSQHTGSERLAVEITPERGYHTASVGEGANATAFEPRLRRYERQLRERRPQPRYRVKQASPIQLGTEDHFWVIGDTDGEDVQEAEVTARVVYVGTHCLVYLDTEVPDGRLDERLAQIGREFDTQIYPTDVRLFGAPLGANDTRTTLLITPVVGNYGRDTTIGYFTVRDLYSPDDDPNDPVLGHSNQRFMLYVSSSVVARGAASDYLGTIAHEFQHLLNASQKLFRPQGPARTEDVWLDEGLAMYAMEANGYGLTGAGGVVFNHVAAYQRHAPQYSLTEWGLNPEESGYGAVYLFTAYLVDRFGERILKELVASPLSGEANVDQQVKRGNTSFQQVFNDWTAANLLDDTGFTTDPRFQYRTLSMLGTYGSRKLKGMTLEPVTLPNTGALQFKPYSAHYYYVPRGNGGSYRFSLSARNAQNFTGLLVAP